MIENAVFEKIDFSDVDLADEYYQCSFVSCDFSKKLIQASLFDTCEFASCNFTLCKFKEILRDVTFMDCKMTGADFTELSQCSNTLVFKNSLLDYANFVAVKMRRLSFRDCGLKEAYFDDADIAFSVFDKCDLTRASFDNANLERVDFSSAFNFSINPTACKLKKTIFSESELKGLVAHLNIEIR